MKRFILICCLIMACNSEEKSQNFNFTTTFETSEGTKTATYEETISYYEALADHHKEIHIQSIGETDSGKPLHLVTLSANSEFDFETLRNDRRIILINNGIIVINFHLIM